MPARLSRAAYADMFGPTAGDKVRLADTELFVEVERDFTTYGEEVKFGGGKVIRDGMGQSQAPRADGAVDTVITNALILDHWGIVKADVGLKDGRIAAVGKAGNPDTQPGVDIVVGPGTEAIAGEGKILTAGGIDCHIHFICPQLVEEALMSGITTMLGGGTGPATGTNATTCTPGPWHLGRMIQAADALPINLGFAGKGNSSQPAGLVEQVKAGACALKLHEDWGTTPAAIDTCLSVADEYDVPVCLHTDSHQEAGELEDTLAAIGGRTIHAYHIEGLGGSYGTERLSCYRLTPELGPPETTILTGVGFARPNRRGSPGSELEESIAKGLQEGNVGKIGGVRGGHGAECTEVDQPGHEDPGDLEGQPDQGADLSDGQGLLPAQRHGLFGFRWLAGGRFHLHGADAD